MTMSRSLRPWMAFVLVALLAMLPELLAGTSYSFSFRYNLVWADQVIDQMRGGDMYPRWLAQSWDGMGSPTFYFYAPLHFLLTGWLGLFGLPAMTALSVASACFSAASGLFLWQWLKARTSPRAAMIAGLFYAVAPYHLHEIYTRGALAEATSYAALPLVLIGLDRVAGRKAHGLALLAVSYALLILGHMPVALLASLTFIPVTVLTLYRAEGRIDWRFLVQAVAGGALGIALSAAFWFPALGLLDQVSSDQLFSAAFSPSGTFFFSGPGSIFAEGLADNQAVNVLIATGYFTLGVAALIRGWRDRLVRSFALLVIVCYGLVSGLIPFVWDLPLLKMVQFPARILPVMECAAVIVTALAWRRLGKRDWIVPALLTGLGALMVLNMAQFRISMAVQQGAGARAIVLSDHRDAPEYLPKGWPMGFDDKGRADPSAVVLPDMPLAILSAGKGQILSARALPDGGIALSVKADGPAKVTVRRFLFPGWTLAPLSATSGRLVRAGNGLVSWDVPAGTHTYTLTRGVTLVEKIGWAISCAALVLLLAVSIIAGRRRTWLTPR